MRVVQLIDSLEAGGAERMAINYANALINRIEFSGLVATRAEGSLKNQINDNVSYLFLERKGKLGFNALLQFRKYIKNNKVQIIHAHSSSYFFAVMVKIIYPTVKIIWHDHFGNRVKEKNSNLLLKIVSYLFSLIISVNRDLEDWSKQNLYCKEVVFLPNFATKSSIVATTYLKGDADKRIICLANLKNPKNHFFLLNAFNKSNIQQTGWSLHFVGRDYNDEYSLNLKSYIKENDLEEKVFIYGTCSDVSFVLNQAKIGVLASTYEGFPVALLEYGIAKLAVITTNVGFCKEIIKNNETGLLFSPYKLEELILALQEITNNELVRNIVSVNLQNKVKSIYSEKKVIESIKALYDKVYSN